MSHIIYGLYDPTLAVPIIRYVGYTSKSPERRLIEHVSESSTKARSHRHKWIRGVIAKGVRPEIVVLEYVTADNWQERERFWIANLPKAELVNGTDGGEGLINPSAEVRARIATKVSIAKMGNQNRKGIPHTESSRVAISEGLKNSAKKAEFDAARRGKPGHRISDEAREKIRQSKLGKKRAPFSDEWRAKLSEASAKRVHTEAEKAKRAAHHIGNKWALGRERPESEREAIGAARRGGKWINNGSQSRLLNAGEEMPDGWQYGLLRKTKT